jgi:hypothetical protein
MTASVDNRPLHQQKWLRKKKKKEKKKNISMKLISEHGKDNCYNNNTLRKP